MNKANTEHAVIAVLIQLILWPLFGLLTAGLFAVGIFIGREYSQGEYRLQAITGQSIISMMPWHLFRKDIWNLHSLAGVLFPVGSCLIVYLIGAYYGF